REPRPLRRGLLSLDGAVRHPRLVPRPAGGCGDALARLGRGRRAGCRAAPPPGALGGRSAGRGRGGPGGLPGDAPPLAAGRRAVVGPPAGARRGSAPPVRRVAGMDRRPGRNGRRGLTPTRERTPSPSAGFFW